MMCDLIMLEIRSVSLPEVQGHIRIIVDTRKSRPTAINITAICKIASSNMTFCGISLRNTKMRSLIDCYMSRDLVNRRSLPRIGYREGNRITDGVKLIGNRLLTAFDANPPYQRALMTLSRGICGALADACFLCRALACIGFTTPIAVV